MPDTEVLTDIDSLNGLESERKIVAAIRQGLRVGRLARFLMTYLPNQRLHSRPQPMAL